MLCYLIITIVHMMLVPSCFITCQLLLTVHFLIGCLHFLITKLLRYIKSYYILSSALPFASTVFLKYVLESGNDTAFILVCPCCVLHL